MHKLKSLSIKLLPFGDQILLDLQCPFSSVPCNVQVGSNRLPLCRIRRLLWILVEVGIKMNLADGARELIIAPSFVSGAVANPYGIIQYIKSPIPVSRRVFRVLLPSDQGKGKLASVAVKDLLRIGFHQRLKYGKRAFH